MNIKTNYIFCLFFLFALIAYPSHLKAQSDSIPTLTELPQSSDSRPKTGDPTIINSGEFSKAIRASMAIPELKVWVC